MQHKLDSKLAGKAKFDPLFGLYMQWIFISIKTLTDTLKLNGSPTEMVESESVKDWAALSQLGLKKHQFKKKFDIKKKGICCVF